MSPKGISAIGTLVALSILQFGCVSLSTLDKNAVLEKDESIFVIGVKPENFRISVFPGTLKNGQFHDDLVRPAVIAAYPEGGYVVAKARPGATVGISYVTPNLKDRLLPQSFIPCEGQRELIFTVPSGKVIYIADVSYSAQGGQLVSDYSHNFDAARQYINENYKALKDKLEVWPYDLVPNNQLCAKAVTVVIPR